MNDMTALAVRGEQQSYDEGHEDGWWSGYMAGAWAATQFIMGWANAVEPAEQVPDEFKPFGSRYTDHNYATSDN